MLSRLASLIKIPPSLRRRRPLAAGHAHPPRALAAAGVGLRALAVDWETAAMAKAAVGADLGEALDRLLALAPQVTLDLEVLIDVVAELRDLAVGEVADLRVEREPEISGDLARLRAADAEDVREGDLESLLTRKVDACDSCQN